MELFYRTFVLNLKVRHPRCFVKLRLYSNVCIRQDTTIFFGSILNICYLRYHYVFRCWMLAIVRLYMKTYPVVIQICVGCL